MFPDSKIAGMADLGKDKLKYVVNYGTALHLTDLLKAQVRSSEWFKICYDASLK